MYLRITRALPFELEGFDTRRFQVDHTYDINAPLSELIILSGYGTMEDEPPVDRTGSPARAVADAIVGRSPSSRFDGPVCCPQCLALSVAPLPFTNQFGAFHVYCCLKCEYLWTSDARAQSAQGLAG